MESINDDIIIKITRKSNQKNIIVNKIKYHILTKNKQIMELLEVKASDYGLEETKANQISEMFKPMLDKMVELEKEYNEIISKPITQELTEEARVLRLKYVKVRTGTADVHKELKAFYLKGGRFVDGWKNAQLMAADGIEPKLKAIEDHFEIIKAQKIEIIKAERLAELKQYDNSGFVPSDLGIMPDNVWESYIEGAKNTYELKKEAERIAKEEREARAKAAADETARMIRENARLKKEAEEREAAIALANKAREEKEANEKLEREAKEAEVKRIQDMKLAAEKAESERLSAELKKKEDEERARIEKAARLAELEAQKGDQEKMDDLKEELIDMKTKYSFKSKANKAKHDTFCKFVNEFVMSH